MGATLNLTAARAISGWMAEAELQWLASRALQCQTIIEIGSWQGRSTRALADHCPGVVYAIDPWSGPYYTDEGDVHKINTHQFDKFCAHLEDHINTGRVQPLRSTATGAVPLLKEIEGLRADLVFIDGDHRYANVLEDIDHYLPFLRPGGILSGHDYGHSSWPGVKRAIDERYPLAQRVQSIWWVTV